jgi:hypothetical protein
MFTTIQPSFRNLLCGFGALLLTSCIGGGSENLLPSETECPAGDQLLDASPVALESLRAIMPLGETGPPDHTLPVSHMYWNLEPIDPGDYSLGSHATPLTSPGRIELVAIERIKAEVDYSLHFRICKDVKIKFGHVKGISAAIAAAADESDYSSWADLGDTYVKELSVVFETGEALGTVAGPGTTTVDVAIVDERKPAHSYVRAHDRYSLTKLLEGFPELPPNATMTMVENIVPRILYRQCSVDYFKEPVKTGLEAKIAGFMGEVPALGTPKCQTQVRDVEGTLSGNWFKDPNDHSMTINEEETIALVPFFTEPTKDVFSIPVLYFSDLPSDTAWVFSSTASGLNNRRFADVSDTSLYCWSHLENSSSGDALSGAFLAQLSGDGMQMTLEYFATANCSAARPTGFTGAAQTYYR